MVPLLQNVDQGVIFCDREVGLDGWTMRAARMYK